MPFATDQSMLKVLYVTGSEVLKNVSQPVMESIAVLAHPNDSAANMMIEAPPLYPYTDEWNMARSAIHNDVQETPWAADHSFINSPHVQLPLMILAICPFKDQEDALFFVRMVETNIRRVQQDLDYIQRIAHTPDKEFIPSSRYQLNKYIAGLHEMVVAVENSNFIVKMFDEKGASQVNTHWFAGLRSHLMETILSQMYPVYKRYIAILQTLAESSLVHQFDGLSSETCATGREREGGEVATTSIPDRPPCVIAITRNNAHCPDLKDADRKRDEYRQSSGVCRGGANAVAFYRYTIGKNCGNEGIEPDSLYLHGISETKRVHQLALRVCHSGPHGPVDICDDMIRYILTTTHSDERTCDAAMIHRQLGLFKTWQADFILPTFFEHKEISECTCQEVPAPISGHLDDGFYLPGTLYLSDGNVQRILDPHGGEPPQAKKARVVERWNSCGEKSTESSSPGMFFVNGTHTMPYVCVCVPVPKPL